MKTKIKKMILWTIRIAFILAILGDLVTFRWLHLFTSSLALFSTYLPTIFSEKKLAYLLSDLQIVMIVFIFSSLYLGELNNFYARFWWWDTMLHTFSGITLGFFAFILIYILNENEKIDVILSSAFIAVFAVSFAVSVGVFWEIFEFAMDSFFGMNMQKSGLVDTMWDLIADCIGAGIAGLYGYLYLKDGFPSFFGEED
ncbi:MAG: hypothetical protein ACQERJ_07800 [Bacillota bacterium]